MEKFLLLFVAGGLGAVSRVGLQTLWVRGFGADAAAWGTALINVLGSFVFGLIWSLAYHSRFGWLSSAYSAIVLAGFLGAFTTFSALAFEAHGMLVAGRWWSLAIFLAGQYVVGIGCLAAGVWVGRPSA